MVDEPKKNFYKKFLYEPFPVESNLLKVLPNHFNAEIVGGTITSKQDAIDYLTWTYFFRRLVMNPSFYGLEETTFEAINVFLSEKVDEVLGDLERAQCISSDEDGVLETRTLGRICSYYYLDYKTAQIFCDEINDKNDIPTLLKLLCDTTEYEELPVRHNEEKINQQLSSEVPWKVDVRSFESPHVKAHLLLQAHFSRIQLPISDYVTDTKSVLDQAVRIIQAMVDVAADGGWLFSAINTMQLLQMVMQGNWFTSSTLLTLPYFNPDIISRFNQKGVDSLAELISLNPKEIQIILEKSLSEKKIKEVLQVMSILPSIDLTFDMKLSTLTPGQENQIKVDLFRHSKPPTNGSFTPLFPKRKDEGWWLVIGDPKTGELLALKRLNFQRKSTTATLTFDAPDVPGSYCYCLYFISDSYMGLDQQYDIKFMVKSK